MAVFLTAYFGTALVLIVLDVAWLGAMGARFYRRLTGDLMRERPNWAPAVLFYLAYPAAVAALAVLPAHAWADALGQGALLGAACYGTYDLTNQATLRRWPTVLSVVDIGWGTAVTAVAAAGGWLTVRSVIGPS